ncbi:MAG: hypothetical protein GXO10_06440 [Crenarchaeota archaeon]|nr:hypothetical protein [Thermoproteota archaeon]
MEVVLTAILAIVLIAVGIIAISYFYSVTWSTLNVVRTRLTIYNIENLLAGIPARFNIPLTCLYSPSGISIELIKTTSGSSNPIEVIYKIPYTIALIYWPDATCNAVPLNPWINASPTCIKANFTKVLQEEYEKCLQESSDTCVIEVYAIANASSISKFCRLEGYVAAIVKDIIINVPEGSKLEIINNTNGKNIFDNTYITNKIVLVRVVIINSTSNIIINK